MLLDLLSHRQSDTVGAPTPKPYPFACGKRVCVGKPIAATEMMETLEGRQLMSVAAPLGHDLTDLPKEVTKAITKELKNLAKAEKHEGKLLDKLDKKLGANVLDQLVNINIPKLSASNLSVNQAGDVVATINVPVQTPIGSQVVPVTLTLDVPAKTAAVAAAAAGTDQVVAQAVTPILNLHLGEIHLDLLGLNVDTSEICLDITATSGPGNLLGNLLTGVANLLNGPTLNLGNIANALNRLLPINLGLNLTRFVPQGGNLLAQGNFNIGIAGRNVSVPFSSPLAHDATAEQDEDVCNILNLELGPVNLNLLGLGIALDNCDDGPITVDVTAERGPGNLLGNLLCGVVGLLDGFPPPLVGGILNRLLGRLF